MKRTRIIGAGLALMLGLASSTLKAEAAYQPFLLGAYTGPNYSTQQFETMVDHSISIVKYYLKFTELPSKQFSQDIAAGRVPLMSWESNAAPGQTAPIATDILAGKYDGVIVVQAQAVAALKGTVMVEWEAEMTDNARNAPFMTGVPLDQQGPTYVAVWQHMHAIFVAEGATNAKWVWSPGSDGYQTQPNGSIKCLPYFPGANYVDWMGYHVYNHSQTPQPYDTNAGVLAFYDEAPQWAPGKPLIQAETGAPGSSNAQYIWNQSAATALPSEFPLVRAFVYYNDGQYELKNQGLSAYQSMLQQAYFNQ
ncbi:MAG: hypothetical protein ABSD74_11775 [Rhizomicrobium sp.]